MKEYMVTVVSRYYPLEGKRRIKVCANNKKEPYEIKSTLQMSDMLGTRDLLKPIVTAYNGAAAQKSAGRPQESEDGSTSDGASIHRDYQE